MKLVRMKCPVCDSDDLEIFKVIKESEEEMFSEEFVFVDYRILCVRCGSHVANAGEV